MDPATFSIFTAISEIFVTAGVFTVIWHNFKRRGLLWPLAAVLMIFEFSVNMLYMISRMAEHPSSNLPGYIKAFAAVHGSLSLLVFILFVVFAFLARREFGRGKYFFADRPALTWGLITLWMLSVGSGEVLFFLTRG